MLGVPHMLFREDGTIANVSERCVAEDLSEFLRPLSGPITQPVLKFLHEAPKVVIAQHGSSHFDFIKIRLPGLQWVERRISRLGEELLATLASPRRITSPPTVAPVGLVLTKNLGKQELTVAGRKRTFYISNEPTGRHPQTTCYRSEVDDSLEVIVLFIIIC